MITAFQNSSREKEEFTQARAGFTLVETLVAISLLAIAIVAPMSLTTQSLVGAYYARDQVTAFFLAQEAIEGVRSVRDSNVLTTALGTPTDLMSGIPASGAPFTVDAHTVPVTMTVCSGTCPPIQTDGELYGYQNGWSDTNFTRSVTATYVPSTSNNEIKISVTVVWQTAALQQRTFTLSENLYRWLYDASAQSQVTPGLQTFPSNGTFVVPAGVTSVNYLVVAGGGGGGGNGSSCGGGGGGGVLSGTLSVTAGNSMPVTVGAGGSGVFGANTSGSNSVFGSVTAIGGGTGGGVSGSSLNGTSGGSGGGGSSGGTGGGTGGAGTGGQGNNGGAGTGSPNYGGGGGGGAGAVGSAGSASIAGNGGTGISSSISGSSVFYGGGGGGGGQTSGTAGTGGSGGGGNGSITDSGSIGTANTGGGGGGCGYNGSAKDSGAGGSGIVIVQPN